MYKKKDSRILKPHSTILKLCCLLLSLGGYVRLYRFLLRMDQKYVSEMFFYGVNISKCNVTVM